MTVSDYYKISYCQDTDLEIQYHDQVQTLKKNPFFLCFEISHMIPIGSESSLSDLNYCLAYMFLKSCYILLKSSYFSTEWSVHVYKQDFFLFKILEFYFIIEDFYKTGNENAQLLNMGVIWPNSNLACLPDKCILHKYIEVCVSDNGRIAYWPYISLHSQSSQEL